VIKETEGKTKYYAEDLAALILHKTKDNPFLMAMDDLVGTRFQALSMTAEVLKNTQDRGKYPPHSWKQVDPRLYVDALLRHSYRWGDNDEESGLPHLYHFICNLAFLAWFFEKGDI